MTEVVAKERNPDRRGEGVTGVDLENMEAKEGKGLAGIARRVREGKKDASG